MALFEFNLPKSLSKALGLPTKSPRTAQMRVLKKLLKRAQYTAFGQKFKFEEILKHHHIGKNFQETVLSKSGWVAPIMISVALEYESRNSNISGAQVKSRINRLASLVVVESGKGIYILLP